MNNEYKLNDMFSFNKILIVDDIFYVKRTISNILSDAGYFVLAASGGHEAIDKIKKYSPDLITVGQKLSDMTVLDFVKSIRSVNGYKDKLLFVSSRKDTDDIDSELSSYFDVLISTPVQKEELITAVKKLLMS